MKKIFTESDLSREEELDLDDSGNQNPMDDSTEDQREVVGDNHSDHREKEQSIGT